MVNCFTGIDASTKSIAWGRVSDSGLEGYGEIFFTGKTFEERLSEARKKTELVLPEFDKGDFIVFERVIMGPNKEVALKMAQMFGAIKSVLYDSTARLVEAPPMVWQEEIGNPVLRGKARKEFLLLHPEWKNKSQQNNGIRDYRKNVTHDIVLESYGEDIQSDNVTDSIGLAIFGRHTLGSKNGKG